MTLSKNFYQRTRSCMYATAAGAVLCSLSAPANAQQTYGTPVYPHPRALQHVEPQRLPQSQSPVKPVTEYGQQLQLTAGESGPLNYASQQVIQTVPANPPEQQSLSFGERIGRIFRKAPTTPPTDPGMHYPKGQNMAASAPPRAPGASGAVIPSIPPTYGTPPQQPALFEPGSSINAIGTSAIPPSPAGLAALPQPQTPVVPTTGPNSPPLQNIPELKKLMVEETPTPPPTPAMAEIPSNPAALSSNAPLPSITPQIAPGEPSEPAAPTAMTAQTTPAQVAPEKGTSAEKDPFADLFPGDQQQPQQTVQVEAEQKPIQTAQAAPAEKVDSATPTTPSAMDSAAPATSAEESPYTGRSLDTKEVAAAPDVLPPPPMEELPKMAAQPTSDDSVRQLKPARLPKLGPPPAPGVPEHELAIPKEPAQLASNSNTPQLEIKPETPPPTQDSAQNDQRSKMDKIAARKDRKGLKGFCPVVLRDKRDLVDASPEFSVTFNGHEYFVSSAEARNQFLSDPGKYAPAAGGCDVIHLALTGEKLEGSLDHAVWYKGRLYLFAGVETMETFVAAPSSHATDD